MKWEEDCFLSGASRYLSVLNSVVYLRFPCQKAQRLRCFNILPIASSPTLSLTLDGEGLF